MKPGSVFWILTKFAVYSAIYMLGHLFYNVGWFIPLFITALGDYAKRNHELSRATTIKALDGDERDAVLSRLDEVPAWVLFPDMERVEWLNVIIKRFWPNLNGTLGMHLHKLEEDLKSNSVLSSFHFGKIDLGKVSPRITGIKVYDKNISDRDLMMDLNICYYGDCELNFSLNSIECGIKDIEAEGTLRVILKQSASIVPNISAVQIYFLNHPVINFELTSALAMLDMYSTGDLIRSVLKNMIALKLVFPNHLSINLAKCSEDLSFKMPQIEGVVIVKVKDAQGVPEGNLMLKVELGSVRKSSNVKVEANHDVAEFDFEYELVAYKEGVDELSISVHSVGDENSMIGRKTFNLSEIKREKVISGPSACDTTSSVFTSQISWIEISDDKKFSFCLLQVYIHSVQSIDAKYRPYVLASVVENKSQETPASNVQKCAATFEKHLNFLIENLWSPNEKFLRLKVVDETTSVEIGEFSYNIADLLVRKNFEHELQTYELSSGQNCKIILAFKLNALKENEIKEA